MLSGAPENLSGIFPLTSPPIISWEALQLALSWHSLWPGEKFGLQQVSSLVNLTFLTPYPLISEFLAFLAQASARSISYIWKVVYKITEQISFLSVLQFPIKLRSQTVLFMQAAGQKACQSCRNIMFHYSFYVSQKKPFPLNHLGCAADTENVRLNRKNISIYVIWLTQKAVKRPAVQQGKGGN